MSPVVRADQALLESLADKEIFVAVDDSDNLIKASSWMRSTKEARISSVSSFASKDTELASWLISATSLGSMVKATVLFYWLTTSISQSTAPSFATLPADHARR